MWSTVRVAGLIQLRKVMANAFSKGWQLINPSGCARPAGSGTGVPELCSRPQRSAQFSGRPFYVPTFLILNSQLMPAPCHIGGA
jgi:hypothetical protein